MKSMKKDPKHFKRQDIGLPGNRFNFISTEICPYYHMLPRNKRLCKLGKINNFYISTGTIIKVKTTENWKPISITPTQDFIKYFPEVALLPTLQFSCCSKFVLI